VPLILDAAAGLGGRLSDQRPIGSQGDIEVFSLHATKVFGVGEGGVLFASPNLAPVIRRSLNFGLDDGDIVACGVNGKLSEFHASVGMAVMDVFDSYLGRRRDVADFYYRALGRLKGIKTAASPGWPPWQTYPVCLPGEGDADEVVRRARDLGVAFRRYYTPALHQSAIFRGWSGPLPNAERLARSMICLPVHSDMTEAEATMVVQVFQEAAGFGGSETPRLRAA
jgi:dTDP-4-amino-4,6-dideoxygalactose transaminase